MALWIGETANFPGQFTAQIPKCTNSRTFHGRERPVSNSRTFPVFPVVWEPWLTSMANIPVQTNIWDHDQTAPMRSGSILVASTTSFNNELVDYIWVVM